ncbi:MAG: hypothetical protein MUC47_03730, partial [Candidatus Kapabacteria bacterium]|nr:hypothetical protein [Candidatus Kapabacteria bacterium]
MPQVNKPADQFVTTSAPTRQTDAPEKTAQNDPARATSLPGVGPVTPNRAPGTYTVENTTTISPVAPGDVFLVSPTNETVLMTPALQIEARVAKGWTLEATVNGERITGQNLAETRVDNRNGITVFSYVGIPVKPGPNQVRLTAVSAPGERGKTVEFNVFGRGPAERLEITEETNATPLPGQLVRLRIRGFDQLGNPAADGPVSLQTSAGRIRLTGGKASGEDDRQLTVQLEGGAALVELSGEASLGTVRVKAVTGGAEASAEVRFSAELRPTLLVGLAELSVGRNAPEIANSNDQRNFLARLAVFYRGRFLGPNLLTLSYDSNRPLNRFGGRDRFGASDALERAYPILGDTSQRFDETPSNSKLYARLDRGLSYVMFGDMDADMDRAALTGYNRRLTGVKLRYEGRNGDFVTLTGARPDTAFARDVFPAGGISLMRLAHRDILPGSEVVTLEVRDRRRPEIILNRETLIRAVDYNLDPQTGEFFLIRPIAAFDADFNLRQITVVYEHRADGTANFVYTGRLSKGLAPLGMRFGASYVNQRQREL